MKQSKKGACSSNTQTAKANCLAHNRRDENTERVPSYVNQNRSHLNRTIFEDDMIRGRKSIVPLVHDAEKLYTEKTGQKCQKSFAPFREACLHLKEGITDGQLMDFKAKVERETKWKVIGIWLHEDEGHQKSKYIEGQEGFAVNHHAHVLFSCQDQNTGKAIRADRTKLSHMQDLLAEATGMERGNKASETGRRHRTAMEQRIYSQEQRVEELYERAKICRNWAEEADTTLKQIQRQNEEEEEERKRIKARQEEDLKAYNTKKAAKEAILSASEGVKGFFRQSSKDKEIKTLREQINNLQQLQINSKAQSIQAIGQVQQEAQKAVNAKEREYSAALAEARRQRDEAYQQSKSSSQSIKTQKKRGDMLQEIVFSLWNSAIDAVNVLCRYLSLPHLNVDFSMEDIAKIEKAMRGAKSIDEREERGRCLVKLAHAQYPGYDDNATLLSTLEWKVEQVARGENWHQQHQSRGRGMHF